MKVPPWVAVVVIVVVALIAVMFLMKSGNGTSGNQESIDSTINGGLAKSTTSMPAPTK